MDTIFKAVFLIGLFLLEAIRFPQRMRVSKERRSGKITTSQVRGLEAVLMTFSFFGLYLFPLLYIFSPWLNFANYTLPSLWAMLGIALVIASLLAIWRAHADLRDNWSPSLEIVERQELVTKGIYHYVRHPIYSAMLLFSIAQALLLHNWVAGLGGLATYIPIILLRVPREERMMVQQFGQEYVNYMRKTGRFFPLRFLEKN